ncbi:hypothetical protein [Marinobacter orientalis]|uniref:Uncharacterized protein n=1 Tax=Marinobacter orientalis TaxID=1928859 RepID=A0A7Y0NKM9_9GAMM|nr:hypothetical protein [Marinobacter orientalis]NMT62764.1 hypothetical protein [Marinobacter orientalis]
MAQSESEHMRLNRELDDAIRVNQRFLLSLQEFRMDTVKLDRELIRDAGRGGDAGRILVGMIALAHAIDVQGFLFSRPLRQDDFEALLSRNRQKKAS